MSFVNEETLLCTSCHHIVSSKDVSSGYAYSHPVLQVLICKKCYKRLSNTTTYDSDKLCLWCGFPGKYTTCSKCSSNLCIKCLRKNFDEDVVKRITKKKSWTCFHCQPELLSDLKAKCTKVLDRMRSNHAKRKRSKSESQTKPSKKHYAYNSYKASSSEDELSETDFSCETYEKVPSSADYISTKNEIIKKAKELSMLFSQVNYKTLKFRNKLENQSCNLKVLQNAFSYNKNILNATICTLQKWKAEITNTANEWKQNFNISLIVAENVKSIEGETVHGIEEQNDLNGGPTINQKRKKFNLSLKKTECENTDDGMVDDIRESSVVADPDSSFCDEDVSILLEDEMLVLPEEVLETKQNDVPAIPETSAPKLHDDDSDHGSIFSETTVILNFNELETSGPSLKDIKDEIGSSSEESPNKQVDSDKLIVCETTDNFAAATSELDISQNIHDTCDNQGAEDDAGSETSFVFDINGYRSKSPPHSASHDSDATETNFNVHQELNTPTSLDSDKEVKNESQSTIEIESENEIEPSNSIKEKSQSQSTIEIESENEIASSNSVKEKNQNQSTIESESENEIAPSNNVKEKSQSQCTTDIESENEIAPSNGAKEKSQSQSTLEVESENEIASSNSVEEKSQSQFIIESESENEIAPSNDVKEKSQSQCTTDVESENEIAPSNDEKEKSQNQCRTNIESENEISLSNDVPQSDLVDTGNIHNSDSETHNDNEVTSIPEHAETTNKQHENKNKSETYVNEENLKHSNKVSNIHEPIIAPNEQNGEDNDRHEAIDNSNDDITDNLTVNTTSNDPSCSDNKNTNELAIVNDDIATEDMVIETDSQIDIKQSLLIENGISDIEITKAKIDFFDELGLYSNIVDASLADLKKEDVEIKNENIKKEDSSTNLKGAIKLLKGDDSGLFDSDSDTSVTSVSDEEEKEEEVENKTKKDGADNAGLINVHFPVLPEEAIVVTNKEITTNETDADTGEDKEDCEHQIQSCTVVLERLEDLLKLPTASTSGKSEFKEIDRLINLNNLDLKRKGDKSPKKGKLKRRKIVKPSGSPASKSGTDNSDSDDTSSSIPSIHTPVMSDMSCEGMLNALLNCDGSTDFDMDTSSKESDSENGDKKKKKRKKRAVSTESNKENQPDNQENDKSTPKELTAEELALAEKRNWRNDPLLRTKLTESGSESESDGTVEGENILSEKTKKKMEALEARMEKRDTHSVTRKSPLSSKYTSENETDKDVGLSSENDDAEDVKPSIIINTDTDSDIEFISEVKKRSPGKSSKPKNSIAISSEEDDTSDGDENESSSKTKGRKNIRAILSDETLEEATKKANLIEKKRKDRLNKKHEKMDSIFSQSQILSQEEGLILDVNEETQSPLVVVHSRITKRLKDHQKEGVRFMWESCYEGVKQMQKDTGSGCIIAHCMGLGKSFQVVALVHTLFAHPVTNTKHVVVVCPLSIVLNWKNEFKQGMEGLNDNVNINIFCISERHNGMERRLFIVDKWRRETGVLIMGYEAYERLTKFTNSKTTQRDENVKKALVDPGPNLVVLDEGHLLKNGKNIRTKALMKVKTKRRIVLTGTPLQNNLTEYYHMVQFVKPNLLGSYGEYTNRFVNPIMNGQFHDSTEEDIRKMKKRSHVLNKMLKDTIQRYEVTELQAYLPSKSDYVIFIQPHIIQAQLYEKYLDTLKTETGVVKGSLINNYHKLHSLWTHPYLLYLKQEQKKSLKKSKEIDVINLDPEINDADESPDGWWHELCPEDYKTNIEYGPKFKVMLSIIRECEKVGDKVLIFSSSLLELDAIESFLQQNATPTSQWKLKEDYYRMDGTVLPDARLKQCNAFNNENNKNTRVFLISNRVGGLGLNLVAANRVILMDVNWNPAYDSQSVFRTYRFGQTKQCYVYRLVSMGTMEEVVYQRQINKLAIAGRVVDEMQISRHYKSDDLQKMYRLDYNIAQERPQLAVPSDTVLATAIQDCEEIFKYHEHQSLLENKPEEELDEDEMKLAWDEFNTEKENHIRQIEEQKKRQLAQQAGPSGVNAFTPWPMARPVGVQQIKCPYVNPNFKSPMQSSKVPASFPYKYRPTNSTKTKAGSTQPEPFEVVLLEENRQSCFNAEETVEFQNRNQVQQQNVAQSDKQNELSKQFQEYIKQFSHQTQRETASINKKLAPPQRGGANKPNVLFPPITTQAQSKDGVVMPQIINTFTQAQASVNTNVVDKNLGYVLPTNIASLIKERKPKRSYVRNVGPLLKTQVASGYTVPPRSRNTNVTNSRMENSRPNNIQIVRKTQLVGTSVEAQSASKYKYNNTVISKNGGNHKPIPVVDLKNVIGKTKAINARTEPQLSTSTSKKNSLKATALPKNAGNTKPTALIDIQDVFQEIHTVPADPQPSTKTKNKINSSNAGVLNDDLGVIDVDAHIIEQEELIKSLNQNMNITLSVCDKPNQTVLESPEIKVNGGASEISISAIPRNSFIQSNSNDVIEID